MTVLRPFNTYGRRDNTHFLVERMLVQMLRGDTVKLGDPTPERDLLYIDDHIEAYMNCFAKPQASIGQAFNFCTGERFTVRAVAEKMRAITGFTRPNPLGHDPTPTARYSGPLRRLRQGEIRTGMGGQGELGRRPSAHRRFLAQEACRVSWCYASHHRDLTSGEAHALIR